MTQTELQRLKAELAATEKGIQQLEAEVEALGDDAAPQAVERLHDASTIKMARRDALRARVADLEASEEKTLLEAEVTARDELLRLADEYRGRMAQLSPSLRARVMQAVEEEGHRRLDRSTQRVL